MQDDKKQLNKEIDAREDKIRGMDMLQKEAGRSLVESEKRPC